MDIKLIGRQNEGELLLSGRLDANNSEEVAELFFQMADRFENITLNMDQLKYISSAGLRALKKLYLKLRGKGGELSVSGVSPNIMEVFEMTGIAEMLNIQ